MRMTRARLRRQCDVQAARRARVWCGIVSALLAAGCYRDVQTCNDAHPCRRDAAGQDTTVIADASVLDRSPVLDVLPSLDLAGGAEVSPVNPDLAETRVDAAASADLSPTSDSSDSRATASTDGAGAAGSGGTGSGGSGGTGTGGSGGGSAVDAGLPDAPACQPKPRDCASALDNDCNGKPDKEETAFCACPVGDTRSCQEHAGLDGKGICAAGTQKCAASADKTTSAWGTCSGSVGPATEICDADKKDEDCDGQQNESCECVNGTTTPCDCGGIQSCTNGALSACSKTKATFYRDVDGDGYGDPDATISDCTTPAGYVPIGSDCDDGNGTIKPGYATCSANSRRYCDTDGGGMKTEVCTAGCLNGACRTDGKTVGYSGVVTCGSDGGTVVRCSTTVGCYWLPRTTPIYGVCGDPADGLYRFKMSCDGPNDCPSGQVCCAHGNGFLSGGLDCYPGSSCPPNDTESYSVVCDPLAPVCPYREHCAMHTDGMWATCLPD